MERQYSLSRLTDGVFFLGQKLTTLKLRMRRNLPALCYTALWYVFKQGHTKFFTFNLIVRECCFAVPHYNSILNFYWL
jgi:hypothetical protein